MKSLNVKRVLIAASIAYLIGVSAFLASFFVPVMADPKVQGNLVLSVVIIPASILGAYYYYRKGHHANGFLLGASMFLITMILDALITVPLFVIPAGGDHISFFSDPFFWLIGLEYILAVALFRWFNKNVTQGISPRTLNSRQ